MNILCHVMYIIRQLKHRGMFYVSFVLHSSQHGLVPYEPGGKCLHVINNTAYFFQLGYIARGHGNICLKICPPVSICVSTSVFTYTLPPIPWSLTPTYVFIWKALPTSSNILDIYQYGRSIPWDTQLQNLCQMSYYGVYNWLITLALL